MQARDREPLRCIPSDSPVHSSSMPELPSLPSPSALNLPSTILESSMTEGFTSTAVPATTSSGSPVTPPEEQPAPRLPTSNGASCRRVRFQGDDLIDEAPGPSNGYRNKGYGHSYRTHGRKGSPTVNGSPSMSRKNHNSHGRNKSYMHEPTPSTSAWSKMELYYFFTFSHYLLLVHRCNLFWH